jgi:hypothetical protein
MVEERGNASAGDIDGLSPLTWGNEYVEKKQKYINPMDFTVLVSFFSIHFQNRLPPAKCRRPLS